MKFNINGYVKVKLSEVGLKELKRQHEVLNDFANGNLGEFKEPEKDHDGFSKFQMWVLMQKLGYLCGCGKEPPFETEIIILE